VSTETSGRHGLVELDRGALPRKGRRIVTRWTRIFIWIERALLVSGMATLCWCVFVVGEAWAVQRLDRRVLESPAPDVSMAVPSRGRTVNRGAPLAQLQIARIGLAAVVLEGDDDGTLRLGPGHIVGTALPGRSGNIAIAGHRDTFFRPLRRIRVGDEITLISGEGRSRYRVSSLRIVGPDDLSVLDPTVNASLTLVTCYPFSMLGHAPNRFIVRAHLISSTTHGGAHEQVKTPTYQNGHA
jgi:sortase A